MACLFTSSGAAARKFPLRAEVGNIGINVGVAAPNGLFPLLRWKESFFGDMHAQGRDAIDSTHKRRWSSSAGRKSVAQILD